MVVGENAKSQGKGASNKKPLVNALTAALLALGGSNALAADILITTPTTDQVVLGNDQSILVDGSGTNTSSIIVSPISAISVPNATSAGAITNSGSISGASFGIYASSSTLWMVTPGRPRIDSIGDIGITSIKNVSSQKQI